jgi:hypothetical protein
MATDYLSLDQVCLALGVSAPDVKAMVADGRLHEFRDAGKVFFKRAEVEKMAAKEGSSIVDLAADEEIAAGTPDENASFASALSSLADSSSSLGLGGSPGAAAEPNPEVPSELNLLDEPSPAAAGAGDSGSSLGLSPLSPMEMQADDFPQELPAAPKAADPAQKPDFTSEINLLPADDEAGEPVAPSAPAAHAAEVPDLGLSGSSIMNLEPGLDDRPAAVPPPPKPAKAGISVFEDEEVEIAADPMGETRISAGVDELEAVGSGSGLLDLTQVSDDTSLGAELLDVISPTEAAETETEAQVVETAGETVEDSGAVVAEPIPEQEAVAAGPGVRSAAAVAAPRAAAYAAVEMPGAAFVNVCVLLGLVSLAILGLATAGSLQGVWPSFLTPISKDVTHYSVFGGMGLLAFIFGLLAILKK